MLVAYLLQLSKARAAANEQEVRLGNEKTGKREKQCICISRAQQQTPAFILSTTLSRLSPLNNISNTPALKNTPPPKKKKKTREEGNCKILCLLFFFWPPSVLFSAAVESWGGRWAYSRFFLFPFPSHTREREGPENL